MTSLQCVRQTTFVLGMRKDCEVLIHVNIEQALAGQIPVFGVVGDQSMDMQIVMVELILQALLFIPDNF